MELTEVQDFLSATGFPVAYGYFTEEEVAEKNIRLPFITWLHPFDNHMSADGVVYYAAHHISCELYEEYRDEQTENAVEHVLENLYYTKSIDYIDSEKMYKITYEFEV